MAKLFATKTLRHDDEFQQTVFLCAFVAISSGFSGLGLTHY